MEKHPSPADILKNWLDSNESPYPTKEEKLQLATEANLTEKQVNRWFVNERAKRKKVGSEISAPPSKKNKTNAKSTGDITAIAEPKDK
jgi:ABC-type proline/glycine betaine transport system substrate-binding protein